MLLCKLHRKEKGIWCLLNSSIWSETAKLASLPTDLLRTRCLITWFTTTTPHLAEKSRESYLLPATLCTNLSSAKSILCSLLGNRLRRFTYSPKTDADAKGSTWTNIALLLYCGYLFITPGSIYGAYSRRHIGVGERRCIGTLWTELNIPCRSMYISYMWRLWDLKSLQIWWTFENWNSDLAEWIVECSEVWLMKCIETKKLMNFIL